MRLHPTPLSWLVCASLVACQGLPPPTGVTVQLEPRSGSQVRGSVRLTPHGDGLWVQAEIEGLQALAEHGFHVHERGDCSAPDGSSAGGHFNPHGAPHGQAGAPGHAHHAGDMPNLRADSAGRARYSAALAGLTLDGPNGVRGRSVVVHRDADDYRSQPAGNSGPRIACAVIAQ